MQLTQTTFGAGRGPGSTSEVHFPTVEWLIDNGSLFIDGQTITLEAWENALKSHKYVQAFYGDDVDDDGQPIRDWYTDRGVKGYNAAKKYLAELLTAHFGLDDPSVRLKVSFSQKYDDFETKTRKDAKANGVIVYTLSVDNTPVEPTAPDVEQTAPDATTDDSDTESDPTA